MKINIVRLKCNGNKPQISFFEGSIEDLQYLIKIGVITK